MIRTPISPKILDLLIDQRQSHKSKRKLFTAVEDQIIRQWAGIKSWVEISYMLCNRTSRQVRERYNTYLKPGINTNPWTPQEDALLIQKVQEIGPHWANISKFFVGRSSNACKNRWNVTLQKQIAKSSTLEELSIPPSAEPPKGEKETMPSLSETEPQINEDDFAISNQVPATDQKLEIEPVTDSLFDFINSSLNDADWPYEYNSDDFIDR